MERGFSATALFDTFCARPTFLFGLHRDTPTEANGFLVTTTRASNLSKSISATRVRSPMRLMAPTAPSTRSVSMLNTDRRPFTLCMWSLPADWRPKAHRSGVKRLIHISGIGSDPTSSSLYIRKRGEGEQAVRTVFSGATLVRSAVMFGPDDAFLTNILKLLRQYPIYPMFGRGLTRLQPAYVDDMAEAIARALLRTETNAITYECAGPRTYTYEELLRTVAHATGRRPILIPVPFAAWHVAGWISELFPRPPITRNQVELMQINNISSGEMPGFSELGIRPQSVEQTIPTMLRESIERTGS